MAMKPQDMKSRTSISWVMQADRLEKEIDAGLGSLCLEADGGFVTVLLAGGADAKVPAPVVEMVRVRYREAGWTHVNYRAFDDQRDGFSHWFELRA